MKLLITSAFRCNEEQYRQIELLGYDIVFSGHETADLQIDVSDIDGVICNGLFLHHEISKFHSLKFIQLTSAGKDRVPLKYIEEHRIKLYNAKGVYSIPIAEWVVLKILEVFKRSEAFYKNQRLHKWQKQRNLLELAGKTVAIIGLGDIGCEVIKRLKAFDVHTIGVGRRNQDAYVTDEYYTVDKLDDVLSRIDILVLCLPKTNETYHLIDSKRIKLMKDDCLLVNISRGEIIDENALIAALQDGKFLAVALDVFEQEPLPENSLLWDFENVIITPHNSFVSDMNSNKLYEVILQNLKEI